MIGSESMRIVCCDDDIKIGEQIKKYLKLYFEDISTPFPEFSFYSAGEDLLAAETNIDIAFLDVEMPGLNGIQLGEELKRRFPNIIIFIVTSYPDYLDDAMRFHVFRYLSKPLDKNRLFRNMKDALTKYSSLSKKLQIETKNQVTSVYTRDIIFVEAKERKVFVYTEDGIYESIQKIDYWINKLPSNSFFQSHRSYIVNFRFVSQFDNALIHLCKNQYTAYLTRRKFTAFKNAYILYLESMR